MLRYNTKPMPFDAQALRRQFSILRQTISNSPLIYLDNAATTQKPQCVPDTMDEFYKTSNANINRGVHKLGERATVAYDNARKTVQQFINAKHAHEIIFTRNTTEAINLVARTFGDALKKGDAIALSLAEHHSNIVPWLQLKDRKDVMIEWIGLNADGSMDIGSLRKILKKGKVKLVPITGLSNVLGSLTDLPSIIPLTHEYDAKILIDAAQLAPHAMMDVQKLDCDFLAFSGHKVYGPTGIGMLYGKQKVLDSMPPFLGGGDMIQTVEKDGFTVAELPRKFEAGTPAIAEAVGLAAALEWLMNLDRTAVMKHEQSLLKHALERLQKIPGIKLLGNLTNYSACISFTVDGIHPHDLTDILGQQGICLRAGHHCTQPLHKHLGINASTRLSVALYNTMEEIDRCVDAIEKTGKMLNG